MLYITLEFLMNEIKIKLVFLCILLLPALVHANNMPPNSGIGTVAETVDVPSYVYIRVMLENDEEAWLATSPIDVNIGDEVSWDGGNLMKDFGSRTLGRSFDWVVFAENVELIGKKVPEGHPQGHEPHAPTSSESVDMPEPGDITRLENGFTVAEIHAQRTELAGQQVTIRARVMKVSEGILGRNWITLQDGTGETPLNRLIATTSEVPEIGKTLVVHGTVGLDVDLGSGYNYATLLEEADFTE
jgi:hypothetical protein